MLVAQGDLPPFSGFLVGFPGAPVAFSSLLQFSGLLIGIALLISLVWLWQMKRIGWAIVMILEIISLIIGIANGNIVGAIIALIVVIYLYMKRGLFR